jgi:central glycolytic genes regulator
MVVPGRGGLGEKVEIQANTIAAKIAQKVGGRYRLLHIPDNIKKENIAHLITEPSIERTLETLSNANILLHGVGNADKMAERRNMTDEQINNLSNDGAIGESFGYYFAADGDIVHSTTSVGLSLNKLPEIEKVIAVAAGRGKAEAIVAAVSPRYQDVLITDEQTAEKILRLC